ncbi:MAG: hypothetical protein HDR00_06425 [Lachnospiraceae bacterium]|nr:hypothetical protein [Lachnospiraceae bacterium]
MLKKWIILAGCFFGGILLCGLGTGVSFVEFSGLSYAGERQMGTIEEATLYHQVYEYETMDTCWIECYSNRNNDRPEIVSDNSLPEGGIEMDVEYNDDFERPSLYQRNSYSSEEETAEGEAELVAEEGYIHISLYSEPVKIIMRYKDIALEDLKNGQIGSYAPEYGTYFTIKEIRYSPELEGKIKVVY